MKGVEFVCSGNNGRSPMAEVVAREYVRQVGADIPIYSSGVRVNIFGLKPKIKPETLEIANSIGIYGSPRKIIKKLWEREAEFRNQALKMRGYNSLENHLQRQTTPERYVDLMLAVADKEKELLLNLHPLCLDVYTIAEYAGVELSEPEVREWLTNADAHLVYLDSLIKVVPKAIDRYRREVTH